MMTKVVVIWMALMGLVAAATPKLVTVGQVSEDVDELGRVKVLVMWVPDDGVDAGEAFAVYRRAEGAVAFERLAVVRPTFDVPTVRAVLNRAGEAGLDNEGLEGALDVLLGEGADAGVEVAEKLSRVLRGEFPEGSGEYVFGLLGRSFPQVRMVMGQGYLAVVEGGVGSVFEVRRWNVEAAEDEVVVGRVAVGDEVVYLPAPGAPVQAVETRVRGDLRVGLRWCLPEDLRRRSAHVSGYALFRARRVAWEGAFGVAPPAVISRALLMQAYEAGVVERVNGEPVVLPTVFECPEPPEAGGVAFIYDDNDSEGGGRFDEGGAGFEDGEQLTYWGAALNFFGTVGEPSVGTDVVVCDRRPPLPPRRLKVENRYSYDEGAGSSDQRLVVSWRRHVGTDVTRYYVYRWRNPAEALLAANLANPLGVGLLGSVENTGDGERLEFEDSGLSVAANAGETYHYTVRAMDGAVCVDDAGLGNLSAPSAPAFGVLRDWDGPTRPGGGLVGRCCRVEVAYLVDTQFAGVGTAPLRAVRSDERVAWVEFRVVETGELVVRAEFLEGEMVLNLEDSLPGAVRHYSARFGERAGGVSPWEDGTMGVSSNMTNPGQVWTAGSVCDYRDARICDVFGGVFVPVDPGDGSIEGICGTVTNHGDAAEWRAYRKVGRSGVLAQIASGKFVEGVDANWCDEASASGGMMCYYLQVFGPSGNPSVVVPVGCVKVAGVEAVPVPQISEVVPLGTGQEGEEATMEVNYFCPGPAVEYFELAVRTAANVVIEDGAGQVDVVGGIAQAPVWEVKRSGRVAAGFGNGGPEFEQAFVAVSGVPYEVKVRAVGRGTGEIGDWSPVVKAVWTFPGEPVLDIPWPARGVPGVNGALPLLHAEYYGTESAGLVEIGRLPRNTNVDGTSQGIFLDVEDVEEHLDVPLGFVVYRVTTSDGGRGEAVQVGPLMREILVNPAIGGGSSVIQDRLVRVRSRTGESSSVQRIWFFDTQPLMSGESYQYTLVFHGEDGEIVDVRKTVVMDVQ